VEVWLSDDEIDNEYSSIYWNDEESEKGKEFWIEDGSYSGCYQYLAQSGLLAQWEIAKEYLEE